MNTDKTITPGNVTVFDAVDYVKASGEMCCRLIKRGADRAGQIGEGYHRLTLPADQDTASIILETNEALAFLGFPPVSSSDVLKIETLRQVTKTGSAELRALTAAAVGSIVKDALDSAQARADAELELKGVREAHDAVAAERDALQAQLDSLSTSEE